MTQGRKPTGPDKAVLDKQRGRAILLLAAHLVEKRKDVGISQQALSSQAGLGRHGVHRLEKAQADPKLSAIEAVADVLGTTPSKLLE